MLHALGAGAARFLIAIVRHRAPHPLFPLLAHRRGACAPPPTTRSPPSPWASTCAASSPSHLDASPAITGALAGIMVASIDGLSPQLGASALGVLRGDHPRRPGQHRGGLVAGVIIGWLENARRRCLTCSRRRRHGGRPLRGGPGDPDGPAVRAVRHAARSRGSRPAHRRLQGDLRGTTRRCFRTPTAARLDRRAPRRRARAFPLVARRLPALPREPARHPRHRRARAQHPHRLHRADLARARRLHGRGRLRRRGRWPTRLGAPFWLAIPAAGAAACRRRRIVVGVPSLRIKGLYLAIATLAAQVDLRVGLHELERASPAASAASTCRRRASSASRSTPTRALYFLILAVVDRCTPDRARNLFRTRVGPAFVAIRDRDLSAEIWA